MYAGFWNRFAAVFFDGLVLLVPYFLISFLGGLLGAFGAILAIILILAMFWLYDALLLSSANQATVGKMILGIKVTDLEGNRISFLRATGRFFAKMIAPVASGIVNLIGVFLGPLALIFSLLGLLIVLGAYLMAVFTPRKQALHDMVAGTMVVDKSTEPGTEPSGFKPAVGWAITTSVAITLTPMFAGIFGLLFLGLAGMSGMSGATASTAEATSDFAAQATVATAASLAEGTKFAVEQYAQTHDGIYPSSMDELVEAGIGISSEYPGVTISIAGEGIILATIAEPAGQLQYKPSSEGGLTNWTCIAQNIPPEFAPDDCTPQ